MRANPRPDALFLKVERQPAEGTCPHCGSEDIKAYPVLSEGGWWDVCKCQSCLVSLSRTRGPLFGTIETLTSLLAAQRSTTNAGGR